MEHRIYSKYLRFNPGCETVDYLSKPACSKQVEVVVSLNSVLRRLGSVQQPGPPLPCTTKLTNNTTELLSDSNE